MTYFPKFSSAIAISMKDLAGMLKQTDQYTTILINPFGCRFKIPMDIFLSQFGFISNKIKDVKNEELNQLLCKKDFSDDELKEKLLASTVIILCIDEPEGTSFVLIFDDDDKEYFQVYTDLDEYKKGLEHDLSEIYPPAYSFSALLKFAKEYFVMNRSSDSVVFRAEIFR